MIPNKVARFLWPTVYMCVINTGISLVQLSRSNPFDLCMTVSLENSISDAPAERFP